MLCVARTLINHEVELSWNHDFLIQKVKNRSIVLPWCLKPSYKLINNITHYQPWCWSAFYFSGCFQRSAGFFAMAAALAAFVPSIPPFPRTQPATSSGASAPRARWNGTSQVGHPTGCNGKTMEGMQDETFLAVGQLDFPKKITVKYIQLLCKWS